MNTYGLSLRLTLLALGLAVCLPGLAETPQQVQQRLERYRQQDEAAAQRKALQAVEAAQRHERTLQWQEQRRREEYARRWKCYGEVEIDVLSWKKQKDGTWVTNTQPATDKCNGSTQVGRIWVRLRYGASVEKLADDLAYDESRLARLNGVDLDHYFQGGDWLLLPAWVKGQIDKAFALDSISVENAPPQNAAHSLRLAPPIPPSSLRPELPPLQPGPSLPLPSPGQLGQLPAPRRFAQSLNELVLQGVVTPGERSRIRGGNAASLQPFDVSAFQRACSSGALPQQECRGLAWILRWGRQAGGTSQPVRAPSPDSLLGVSCTSLMVNRKPAYQDWGNWVRPVQGSPDEQLVIDRCATASQ